MFNLFALWAVECFKYGLQLGVGPWVEGEPKVEGTDLIAVCCFFANGAIVVVLEVLCDANDVKHMPAI